MKETMEKRVFQPALWSFIFVFMLTSELVSCQFNILPPDCVTDAANQTRCYQSYEEEAAHSIWEHLHSINEHYNFSNLGWSNTTHPCKKPQWNGVLCEEKLVNHGSGEYYEVSLSSWNMEELCTDFSVTNERMGLLPAEFGKLANLRTLTISNCPMFYGPIPQEIFQLPWLTILYLFGNSLNGSMAGILDSSVSASGIEEINFSNNKISGVLPFPYNMSALKSMDLSQNFFSTLSTDWCLDSTSFDTNFVYLNLSNNNLTGTLCLDNVRTIETVDISGNHMKNIIASNFTNTSDISLMFIYAQNNNITTFPTEVLLWPTLEEINLDDNHINGVLTLPYVYTATSNLAIISLVNNNITDIIWESPEKSSLLDERHLRNLELILLLGGNPICENLSNRNADMKDLLRILCRDNETSSIPDPYPQSNKISRFAIIMISSTSAVIVLVLFIILTCLFRKLRKQTLIVRRIQSELSKREVKPYLYSYSELKFATQDFHLRNKLGEGGFGVVYKGIFQDGSSVAIKKLKVETETTLQDFLNEIVVISSIKHRNLVQLKGCCLTGQERIIVYELVNNKNLAEALWEGQVEERSILQWEDRFNIIIGIARGLLYLHEDISPTIIHRDIKPQNILLDEELNPKIADFGTALLFPDLTDDSTHKSVTRISGTRGYVPPEYASFGQVSTKLDVFSFGVLILEIIAGRKNIDHEAPVPQRCLYDWAQNLYDTDQIPELIDATISDHLSAMEVNSICMVATVGLWCIQVTPTRRPSMSQALDMLLGNVDIPQLSYHGINDHLNSNSVEFVLNSTHHHLEDNLEETGSKEIDVNDSELLR